MRTCPAPSQPKARLFLFTTCLLRSEHLSSPRVSTPHRHHRKVDKMAASATLTTAGVILGTPVVFFPVPTPWSMCGEYVLRRGEKGQFVAFDPIYSSVTNERGQPCYSTQQSLWFYQENFASTSAALGPTFVCLESYTSTHSTLVDSNTASLTQYTYCCPTYAPRAATDGHVRTGSGPGVTKRTDMLPLLPEWHEW